MNNATNKEIIREFCTGCGLCSSEIGTKLNNDEKGFCHPSIEGEDLSFYCNVCPAMGNACSIFSGDVWGREEIVWLAWAEDSSIRNHSSSGGVLTALSCYLIENKNVDGIIQTMKDPCNPTNTITIVSKTENEIKNASGSRYSISHPLLELSSIVDPNKKYAFVGKPCDVSALRMHIEKNKKYSNIVVLMSFFCAGMPSLQANNLLLKELNATDDNKCVSLSYRGDGWPGYASAVLENGEEYKLSYQESWRNILGRDVAKICRFCIDGIGECADITCGDAWYLSKDGTPIFEEAEGRNVVFARTSLGRDICEKASKDGYISLLMYDSYSEELKLSQKYQYNRRTSMRFMIMAMKTLRRCAPLYKKRILRHYDRGLNFHKKMIRYLGTIRRILKGRI